MVIVVLKFLFTYIHMNVYKIFILFSILVKLNGFIFS